MNQEVDYSSDNNNFNNALPMVGTGCLSSVDECAGMPRPIEDTSNFIRNINIRQVNRGYIVEVGCHTFAFSTKEEMFVNIIKYINEPSKTEREWFDGKLFN